MSGSDFGVGRLLRTTALVSVVLVSAVDGPALAASARQEAQAQAPAEAVKTFDIPAQSLAGALNAFGRQADMQVTADAALTAKVQSQSVKGSFTPIEALRRLLAGTGLGAQMTGDRTAVLTRISTSSGATTLQPLVIEGTARPPASWALTPTYVAKQTASGTKTETPLIETPQSITVVTSNEIKATKAVSISDALAYTPGVTAQSQSFSRMVDDLTIRGFNVATGNSGSLRDGMKFQSSVYDGSQEPYGLERIEVLRGASSMLYGQLSPGGVVNSVTKRPTADGLHEINLEYGTYGHKQISGDLGGAISDDGVWSYRLTGLLREGENWVKDTPDDKRYIAPAITWRPSEQTSLTLLSSYQEVRTKFSSPLLYADVDGGTIPRDLNLGEPGFDRYNSNIASFAYLFEHEFDNGMKFRSNARYFHADVKWDYMFSNLAPVAGGTLNRLASKRDEESSGVTVDNSLEFNFGTGPVEHKMLTGVDYYRRGYDSHRYRGTGFIPIDVNNPIYTGSPPINYAVDRGSDNASNQVGAYVQDQMKIDDHWVVVLGGRFDHSDSQVRSYQTGAYDDQQDSAFTGRAGLVYLFDNGIAPFASISQSFEPILGIDPTTGRSFDPSKGLQYEAGIRYQPKGSDLLLSAAIFDLTQTNVLTYDAAFTPYQQGEVNSRGLELEARTKFGPLSLIGAYTYTDAKVTKGKDADVIDEQLALVPHHAFSLWADRTLDDIGLKGLKIGAGARYIGETNLPGEAVNVDGYTLVDAMISYDFGALSSQLAGASLTFNARNLLDKKYYTCVSIDGCRYGEPLTATATLSYAW